MPSSFTSNIAFEKPANGEQTGTWGNTVNDNMDILDRLTSQVGSIALTSSTYTLTTSTSGTVSEGHYSTIRFTGTPGATCTVSISPNTIQRIYTIYNNTNQTVIMSQGSGSTVSISAGEVSQVYSDGAGASAAVVDITPVGPTLAAIGALTPTDGNFIVGNGTTWVAESGNTVLTSIGVTATTTELNILDGVTATTTELNILDGVTADATELNYVEGVTSSIQTQLDTLDTGKADKTTTITAGTGLTGGGDLSTNRTISPDIASQAEAEAGTASDKLMTPQRTAQAITALAPPAGFEFIVARSGAPFPSTPSFLDFTEFDASKYSSYLFVVSNLVPPNNGENLYFRTSGDGGSTYDSGASDYKYTINNTAATGGGIGTGTQSYILLVGHGIGSAFGEDGVSGSLLVTGAGTTRRTAATGSFGVWRDDGAYVSSYITGARDSGSVVNAVQFRFSVGGVESGTIAMYGLRNA